LLADNSVYALTASGTIYRLEGQTGAVQWTYNAGTELAWTRGGSSGTLDDTWLFFVDIDLNLHAVDRQLGTRGWKVDLGSEDVPLWWSGRFSPTVIDDTVYFARYPYDLLGFDRDNGQRVVETQLPRVSPCPVLAHHGADIYIGDPIDGGRNDGVDEYPGLSRFGLEDQQTWRFEVDSNQYPVERPPVIGEDVVYLTDRSRIAAVRQSDGSKIWRANPDPERGSEFFWHAPTLGPDALVTAAGEYSQIKGRLSVLDIATGTIRWHKQPENIGMTPTPPLVVGDTVLFGAENKLFAFRLSDGTTRWKQGLPGVHSLAATEDVLLTGDDRGLAAWTWD
jgi:outer membrane protein assembly factor BamB